VEEKDDGLTELTLGILSRKMVFYLEHVPTGDRVFLEEGENTIGRDPDCSINMHFLYMSRKHVHILVENDRVFIKDLVRCGIR